MSSADAAAANGPSSITVDTANLSQSLTSPTSPTTPASAAGAQRAMGSTSAWKPSFDRRQSWNKEEHKRELQMSAIEEVKTGPGFTERS